MASKKGSNAGAVTVRLSGTKPLLANLSSYKLNMQRAIKQVVAESVLEVAANAQARAPVRRAGKVIGGFLRSSIRPEFLNDGVSGRVVAKAEYAAFVEFGTGQRGSASVHPPLPNGYAHGQKAGMRAQPFLFPALEEETPKFKAKLSRLQGIRP